MKTPSNDLFQLIRSLNKTEKRYFKLYLKNTSFLDEHLYLQLFDAIAAQKEYNENFLKQKLRRNLLIKDFKKSKLNLSKIILKCLDQYYSETLFESTFKNQFKIVNILYQKGLYGQCGKNINKLKRELLFYERYTEILEICRFEKNLPASVNIETDHISALEKRCIDTLTSETELQNLFYNIYGNIAINERARDARTIKKYKTIIASLLLKNKTIPGSFRCRYYFYHTLGFCYSALNQQEKSYTYRKAQVKLIEKNPHQAYQYPELYVAAIHNFLISCFFTKRMKEYYSYLNAIKKLEEGYNNAGNKRLATSIFSLSAILESATNCSLGQFDRIYQLEPEFERKLKRYSNGLNIHVRLTLYYNIAYGFFGAGNYVKALRWINEIINYQKVELRHDVQSFARILNLIIHYEIGNSDFSDHLSRSASRFLNKRGRLYNFESLILNFISKIYPVRNETQRIALFKQFRKQLIALSTDPFEKSAFEDFDMVAWLESKIGNRSFAEIVKEKATKQNR
jgi:hypothetical protein